MKYQVIYQDLLNMNPGTVIKNEPMYKHTTFKVGGPARLYVEVKDLSSLKQLISYCHEFQIQFMVIGKGSDLLFSDREYDGIIISLNAFNKVEFNGNQIRAQAGAGLVALAYQAAKTGLSGFEFMGGIPGTIGGGLYMNAGAYKYAFADVFTSAHVLNENNEIIELNKENMQFGYRHSILQDHPEWILIDALFTMTSKDPASIKAVLDKRKERRMATQPWNMPSAGSVFRNPEKKSAWQYIDEAGLRGYEIGGAQVSPKHSNFIVNNGYASGKNILELITHVESTVYNKSGIHLEKEVILVNWE